MVVIGLGKNLLFKSVLAHCGLPHIFRPSDGPAYQFLTKNDFLKDHPVLGKNNKKQLLTFNILSSLESRYLLMKRNDAKAKTLPDINIFTCWIEYCLAVDPFMFDPRHHDWQFIQKIVDHIRDS